MCVTNCTLITQLLYQIPWSLLSSNKPTSHGVEIGSPDSEAVHRYSHAAPFVSMANLTNLSSLQLCGRRALMQTRRNTGHSNPTMFFDFFLVSFCAVHISTRTFPFRVVHVLAERPFLQKIK